MKQASSIPMVCKWLASLFCMGLSIAILSAQPNTSQQLIDSTIKNKLKAELLQMGKMDQQYRFQLMFGEADGTKVDSLLQLPDSVKFRIWTKMGTKDYTLGDAQYDSIISLQKAHDSTNIKRLLDIYKQYGWPGFNLVGGATAVASAILLHMPDSLQLALYPLLKKEIKKGNIYPNAVATMYDKYLMGTRQPLLYGMFTSRDKTGKPLPPQIKSIAATNKARKEIGMPPLEKYMIVP